MNTCSKITRSLLGPYYSILLKFLLTYYCWSPAHGPKCLLEFKLLPKRRCSPRPCPVPGTGPASQQELRRCLSDEPARPAPQAPSSSPESGTCRRIVCASQPSAASSPRARSLRNVSIVHFFSFLCREQPISVSLYILTVSGRTLPPSPAGARVIFLN